VKPSTAQMSSREGATLRAVHLEARDLDVDRKCGGRHDEARVARSATPFAASGTAGVEASPQTDASRCLSRSCRNPHGSVVARGGAHATRACSVSGPAAPCRGRAARTRRERRRRTVSCASFWDGDGRRTNAAPAPDARADCPCAFELRPAPSSARAAPTELARRGAGARAQRGADRLERHGEPAQPWTAVATRCVQRNRGRPAPSQAPLRDRATRRNADGGRSYGEVLWSRRRPELRGRESGGRLFRCKRFETACRLADVEPGCSSTSAGVDG